MRGVGHDRPMMVMCRGLGLAFSPRVSVLVLVSCPDESSLLPQPILSLPNHSSLLPRPTNIV
jgi:hypothetical protein